MSFIEQLLQSVTEQRSRLSDIYLDHVPWNSLLCLFNLATQPSLSTGKKNTVALMLVSSSISSEVTEVVIHDCIKMLLLVHLYIHILPVVEKSLRAVVEQKVELRSSVGLCNSGFDKPVITVEQGP